MNCVGSNALALLRLGRGLGIETDATDQQSIAVVLAAFRQATSRLFISHMDLAFRYQDITVWPDLLFECWADLLTASDRSVSIKIVLSQPNSEMFYSWNIQPVEIIDRMRIHVGGRQISGDFSIATIQYSRNGTSWHQQSCQRTVANHSKTWIVDDRLFYIGSDNLYPHMLQEFGYLIDSNEFASDLIENYWDPIWRYSKQNAITL
jgi:phosphatidylserine/phosphatidylglycerophosphate/cardiolipin synthase-like enzyme